MAINNIKINDYSGNIFEGYGLEYSGVNGNKKFNITLGR